MNVFLSSTALDLAEYRKVADETIRRLQLDAVAMELFGALPGTPVEECERLARECDVLICIVAHRYGFIPEKGRGSITRREVEAAHNARRDVLVWIVADDQPWTEKKEQDLLADPSVLADPNRVAEVAEGVAGLLAFKTWLRTTFTPDTFTTPDDLGRRIAVALANYIKGHTAPPIPQDRISIAHLPTSGAELFGREKELQILDDAWASQNTTIVSLVAWGGVGKTALVNHWLKRRMIRDNYRGAERVYAWSFFSQGTSERATSADLFIDQALRWFGDADPTSGSPWDKGERLAGYIRQSLTLVVLDGLEPLQHPPGPQEGRLKDAALQVLLVELAAHQPGLCVISTRERIGDLVEFEGSTVIQHDLEHLSPQAGAQILRSFNVKGQDEELEAAAKELSGHAFSLTLLGSYLEEVLDGDIRRRNEIENLFEDSRYGNAAQRMISAYEGWLGEGMELAILRLMGLFDRPADLASIEALRVSPVIPRLTEPLQDFKAREWNQAVAKLRRLKLLAELSPTEPGSLDAHPLIREHFKQQLKQNAAEAWREANNRLYEHLKKTAETFPETVGQMSLLYAALAHGCAADRHSETLEDVYWQRICRGSIYFSMAVLGAFGADLGALSSFFEATWTQPSSRLNDLDKAFVLAQAGYALRALGRVPESIQPMQTSLKYAIDQESWQLAVDNSTNLTHTNLMMGDLSAALELALKAVDFADRTTTDIRKVGARVSLADVYHQMGRIEESREVFINAERMKGQSTQKFSSPFLVGLQGYFYCDLLLDDQQYDVVKERAGRSIEVEKYLVAVGVDNVSLGRALLCEGELCNSEGIAQAAMFLNRAVDSLRLAAQLEFLPWGLLARGKYNRLIRNYDAAERDLTEVYRIATRGELDLHLADFHLESARLQLAQGDKEKAREHFTPAKEMIDRMGYHRRDKEVQALVEQLG